MAARKKAAAHRDSATQSILHRGLAFIEGLGAGAGSIVAGYYPIREEIDPLPLLEAIHRRGSQIAMPAIQPGPQLIFRLWTPDAPLARGKFGLSEPGEENASVVPDILFVPLLAFNRAGDRLGYGAGYYDAGLRAIRKERAAVAAGLAYDEQEVAEIPSEPQDERLDFVLTPSGLIRCGS